MFLSSCFSHSVTASPVVLASVVTMLSLSFSYCTWHGHSVNMFYFPVVFLLFVSPYPWFVFYSIIFSIDLFVPKNSLKILPWNVLLREMISVLLYFPVVLVSILLPLFLRSFWFRFHQSNVPIILFGSWRHRNVRRKKIVKMSARKLNSWKRNFQVDNDSWANFVENIFRIKL